MIKMYMIKHITGFLIIKWCVFLLDGKSVSEKGLLNHYGEPKSTSTSAWGKNIRIKLEIRCDFMLIEMDMLKDKSLVNRVGYQ